MGTNLMLWLLTGIHSAPAQVAPPITAAVLSSGEKQLLFGSQKGLELIHWPEANSAARLESKLANIHDLAFTLDGKSLLVAGGNPGEEGILEVWNWRERQIARRIVAHADVVYRVGISPQGNSYCTASADGTCAVWESAADKPRLTYSGHSRPVLAISYLNDGKSIVSAGVDQTLQLWDAHSGVLLRKFDNHLATINDIAVLPAQEQNAVPLVATASDDRTVRFWQPTIGRMVRFAKLDSPPRVIAWDATGRHVIAGCNDGRVRLISYETTAVTTLEQQFPGRIHVLLVAAETSVLVAGEGGDWKLVNLTSRE